MELSEINVVQQLQVHTVYNLCLDWRLLNISEGKFGLHDLALLDIRRFLKLLYATFVGKIRYSVDALPKNTPRGVYVWFYLYDYKYARTRVCFEILFITQSTPFLAQLRS